MLQGICIDSGYTAVLQKGTSYYLFPNGANHYYVSKFPNSGAHMGCFQASYFQIIEDELWPEEPEARPVSLDPEKLYNAQLIWRQPGYKQIKLQEYYLLPHETHGTFYEDNSLSVLRGCLPLHWFTDFVEVEIDKTITETTNFDIEFDESDHFLAESEPGTANYIQLSLFD
ncbi:hypothetical protein J1P26_21925 [Neobacillus sp. MM2021_6]|uniref:hypothetical protein n=1 Tax=Bacillaceae TaxID=186817 RepID=UPI00140C398A|nr:MULTISPECIES: hypothetical protein [Bacillaceae]MBO0962366.1 hypothetical protein [Neobacillus sp. MM2021_6]NHC20849.1 hypothetical protein [Bacillus sp. MM2020_4]